VGALGLGIHLILLKALLGIDRNHRQRLTEVEAELSEARFWVAQKQEWSPKSQWLETHFQPAPSANPAPALQKRLQSAAEAAGLKVEEQKPPTPRSGPRFLQYSNRMKMTGSLGQFLQWLVNVYAPEEGVAVTSLSLKIGNEPPKMVGEVGVSQFFRPNNP